MSRHTSLPNELSCDILGIGLRASVTPATLWASVTLVTVQTMSMGQTEPDITLMSLVLYGEIVTHIVILFSSDTLTQVNSLQLRCFRHRHAGSRSRFYDSVSPRRHSRSPSRSRGKKKSHKKRKHYSTSSSSSRRSSSSSSRERKRHKFKKKKKHSKSLSSKRDKSKKKHKRKRSPSLSPSSSSSSVSSDSTSSL